MYKSLLTNFSFVIACALVVAVFITARSYTELGVAILLYPMLVFFAYKILSLKLGSQTTKKPVTRDHTIPKSEENSDEQRKGIGISDIDKRVFLKLIGGAGVFLFLLSIFNKKTANLVSKSLPGTGEKISIEDTAGNKIDPAQIQPMDGYRISEMDDNIISFYGFTHKNGSWVVMKADTDTGSFRYARGTTDFPLNWAYREKLSYDYFNKTF